MQAMIGHAFKQRGIVILALACAVLAMAGCGASGGGGTTGGLAPVTLPASDIIAKAKSASIKDGAGTELIVSKSPDASVTMQGKFKSTTSPSRFSFDGTSTTVVGGKTYQKPLVAIYSGSDVYTKIGDTWDKTSGVPQSPGGSFDFQVLLSQVTQAKVVGSETINGKATYHLAGTLPAPTPTSGSDLTVGPTTVDFWIRQDNYYPAQMKFHLTSSFTSPVTGKPATSETNGTLTYASWDTGDTIALPQV